MGYKLQKTLRVDLSDLGDNQGIPFYVEIKNPKMMTVDQQLEFADQAKTLQADGEVQAEKFDSVSKLLQGIIVSWNLLDIDTEQPINPADEGAMKRIPAEVMVSIFNKIGENNGKVADEQKNSSAPSDKSSEGDQPQLA